jgi:hypothetical protein
VQGRCLALAVLAAGCSAPAAPARSSSSSPQAEHCCPFPYHGPPVSPATFEAVENVRGALQGVATCEAVAALGGHVAKLAIAPAHACVLDGVHDAWADIIAGIAAKVREFEDMCAADATINLKGHFALVAPDAEHLWSCLQPPP